jgi:hypothetical protein
MNKYRLYYPGVCGKKNYIQSVRINRVIQRDAEMNAPELGITFNQDKALVFSGEYPNSPYFFHVFHKEEVVEKKWYVEFTFLGDVFYHGANGINGGGNYEPKNGYATRDGAVKAIPSVFKGHGGEVSCVSVVEK